MQEILNDPKNPAWLRFNAAKALMQKDSPAPGTKKAARQKAAESVGNSDRFRSASAPRLVIVNG